VTGVTCDTGAGRRALLARLLVGCDIGALDDAQAHPIGALAARAGTTDIVDACVAEGALRLLPLRWQAEFLAEHRPALDAAPEMRRWQEPRDLLHRWRLRATAYADPEFEADHLQHPLDR
jgi:hypothetical protein